MLSLMPRTVASTDTIEAISGLKLRDLPGGVAGDNVLGHDESASSSMACIVDGQQYIGESHWDIALCDVLFALSRAVFISGTENH